MSAVASPPPPNFSPSSNPDLNTLSDPRAPSPLSTGVSTPKGSQHPDLSNEVATLSTKLINAINHQTNLDDSLQQSRHELEAARERIAQLESDAKRHQSAITNGFLVRRTDSAKVEERLQSTIADERKKRSSAERERRGMEQELETLTSQLFEEANEMVASARHEKETAEKKADQLRAKLKEMEILLASHQDQLSELKTVLSSVQSKPRDSMQSISTAPVTPAVGHEKIASKTFELPTHRRNAHSLHSIQPPESPLHFSHLIHPVVRTDVQSYEDFINLLRTNKGGTSPSRATSGSYTGLNVLGLGSKDMSSQSTVVSMQQSGAVNGSSRTPSAQGTPTVSTHSSNPSSENNSFPTTLKETKYYKRALVEDIEPTLRLDTAPGLSFLSRRTVLTSMTTGKLVVEPFPTRHPFHSPAFACALCGELRTNDEHLRKFRFRTSDSDEAQRYPMCNYCLSRVRSTCDFLSFLREARKGNMRNETIDDCRIAWEECVRLRERMFWSRVGGGVIPAPGAESPMLSADYANSVQASQSDSDLPSLERARSSLSHSISNDQPQADNIAPEQRTEPQNNPTLDGKPYLPSVADLGPSPANSPTQTHSGSNGVEAERSSHEEPKDPRSSDPTTAGMADPSPLRTEQRFSQISTTEPEPAEQAEDQQPVPPAAPEPFQETRDATPSERPTTSESFSSATDITPLSSIQSESEPIPKPPPAPELPSVATASQPDFQSSLESGPAASKPMFQPEPAAASAPAPAPAPQRTRNKIAALASRFQTQDPSTAPSPTTRSPSRPSTPGSRFAPSPDRRGVNAGAEEKDAENGRKGSDVRIPGAFS